MNQSATKDLHRLSRSRETRNCEMRIQAQPMPKVDRRKNLTPTLIGALKPATEGKRYQMMDAQVPGFGGRVTDIGNRTFILRTRYPGSASPSRREIGQCADLTLTCARERARKWRSLVKQGIDPAVEEEQQRQAAIRKQARKLHDANNPIGDKVMNLSERAMLMVVVPLEICRFTADILSFLTRHGVLSVWH
jgi:Arm DNA-binding domain